MRLRLRKYLPIFLIALSVQLLAPIAAMWGAAIAVSDPFGAAAICHTEPAAPGQSDQDGTTHGGACAVCCAAQAFASLDTPNVDPVVIPYRPVASVIWRQDSTDSSPDRIGSNAQARAPPTIS